MSIFKKGAQTHQAFPQAQAHLIQKRGTNASSISAGSSSSYSKKGHKRIKHFRRLKLILFKKGAQTHQAFPQAQAHLIQKRGTNASSIFASSGSSYSKKGHKRPPVVRFANHLAHPIKCSPHPKNAIANLHHTHPFDVARCFGLVMPSDSVLGASLAGLARVALIPEVMIHLFRSAKGKRRDKNLKEKEKRETRFSFSNNPPPFFASSYSLGIPSMCEWQQRSRYAPLF